MDGMDAWAEDIDALLAAASNSAAGDATSSPVHPSDSSCSLVEELEALSAIYGDDLLSDAVTSTCTVRVVPQACRGLTATVTFWLPPEYPSTPPVLQLRAFGSLSAQQQDALYGQMLLLAAQRAAEHQNAMFDVLQVVHDCLTSLVEAMAPEPCCAGSASIAIAVKASAEGGATTDAAVAAGGQGCVADGRALGDLVGPLAAVMARLPREAGAIKVECIVREDLKERFLARRAEFVARGISPAVWTTFHGTCQGVVSSIVRTGLRVPVCKEQVRCGATYGRGIYTSPSAAFSLGYCNNRGFADCGGGAGTTVQLLVCAVLPGRIYNTASDTTYEAGSGICVAKDVPHTSLLGGCDNELVIYDAAQVLPCYVLHLHLERRPGCPYLQASQAGALVVATHRAREVADDSAPRPRLVQVMRDAALDAARLRATFYIGDRQVLEVAPVDDDDDDWWDASCQVSEALESAARHGALVAHPQFNSEASYQTERHGWVDEGRGVEGPHGCTRQGSGHRRGSKD